MTNRLRIIKVDNPCPMTLGRIKHDDKFYCKSCNKIIVDFRDKSVEEIVNYISKKSTCGIFNNDQIVKPKFSLKNNFLFTAFTVFAFFGFNVKPLSAQTKQEIHTDTVHIQKSEIDNSTNSLINSIDTKSKNIKTSKKKWWRKKKKIDYRTMGCPSF